MPASHRLLKAFRFVGEHERGTLVALLVLMGGVWAFQELGELALAPAGSFDQRVLRAMRSRTDPYDPIGPEWLEGMVRDVTSLGGFTVQVMVSVAVIGFLLLERKKHAAWLVAISVAGGSVLGVLLKDLFGRARPEIISRQIEIWSLSFPSGHSMMSAVTYLTLGALLARTQRSRLVKAYVLMHAILLTLAIGLTRIYLGVHWPTDVLAGWTAGAAWALLCSLVAYHLQKRRVVEAPADPAQAEVC